MVLHSCSKETPLVFSLYVLSLVLSPPPSTAPLSLYLLLLIFLIWTFSWHNENVHSGVVEVYRDVKMKANLRLALCYRYNCRFVSHGDSAEEQLISLEPLWAWTWWKVLSSSRHVTSGSWPWNFQNVSNINHFCR